MGTVPGVGLQGIKGMLQMQQAEHPVSLSYEDEQGPDVLQYLLG